METIISVEVICAVWGLIVSGLVSATKKIAFVDDHPKVVAFALALIGSVVGNLTFMELDWASIVACTLTPFAVAVTGYEVVKSATKETA